MLALALVDRLDCRQTRRNESCLLMFPILLFYAFASHFTYAAMGWLLPRESWVRQPTWHIFTLFNRVMAAVLAGNGGLDGYILM